MTRDEWSALKAAAENADGLSWLSPEGQMFSVLASPAAILRLVAHVERLEAALTEWSRQRGAPRAHSIGCECEGQDRPGGESCLSRHRKASAALAATKEPDRG